MGRLIGLFLCLVVMVGSVAPNVEAKKKEDSDFIKGYNAGKVFCKSPGKKCYTSYRNGIQKMHERYGPWCWKYMKKDYVACLSRIWLESRGNPWSHTKDTYLEEAGLTSVSKQTANRLCEEHGVCGDPCGDPEFSIAANGWRGAEQRKNMFTGIKDPEADIPEPTFWASFLPQQWEDNRIEAEYLMSICGGTNCTKLQRALKKADAEVKYKKNSPYLPEGIFEHLGKDGKRHAFWNLIKWLQRQSQAELLTDAPKKEDQEGLFAPLAVSLWRFGFRWGRVVSGWNMRAEFFEPIKGKNGEQKNYCWGDEPWWYPTTSTMPLDGDELIKEIPLFPKPLYKKPKKNEWRDRCVLYGTKGWYDKWDEPQCGDRWKTGGFKYHPITGKPITVKKGSKKYPTAAECSQAKEKWKVEQQAQGLLPSDEEYGQWERDMADTGCAFQYTIVED